MPARACRQSNDLCFWHRLAHAYRHGFADGVNFDRWLTAPGALGHILISHLVSYASSRPSASSPSAPPRLTSDCRPCQPRVRAEAFVRRASTRLEISDLWSHSRSVTLYGRTLSRLPRSGARNPAPISAMQHEKPEFKASIPAQAATGLYRANHSYGLWWIPIRTQRVRIVFIDLVGNCEHETLFTPCPS
jgi:hypothetical protein